MAKKRTASISERFWDRVDQRCADECWPWRGSTKNGYGRFTFEYVEHYAHRMAYALAYRSAPPSGLQVMHRCNNKRCCNPAHLRLGTPSENTQDAYRCGLARSGMAHPRAKFDPDLVARIAADPRPQLAIAAAYGISQSHVSRIKNNQTRRWDVAQEA